MGAFEYCKPSAHLVVGEDVSAAFLVVVGSLPSYLSSLLGSASPSDDGLEKVESPLATRGSPQRTKG